MITNPVGTSGSVNTVTGPEEAIGPVPTAVIAATRKVRVDPGVAFVKLYAVPIIEVLTEVHVRPESLETSTL